MKKITSFESAVFLSVLALGVVVGTLANPILPIGSWVDITPPGNKTAQYGDLDIAIDPNNRSTLYVGCAYMGLWKTTNGGETWFQPGDPNQVYDWTDKTKYLSCPFMVSVDPANSEHLYATCGVSGSPQGFWVSTDGGNNWTRPAGFDSIGNSTATYDVTQMAVDPTNFSHILLSSHSPWRNGPAGVLESTNGGSSWIAHPTAAGFNATGTFGIDFLYDPAHGVNDTKTWLYMGDQGWFRTTDAGTNWSKVANASAVHGKNLVYRASNGALYSGAYQYPWRSTDNGLTWTQLSNSGLPYSYFYLVCGDGTNLYTALSMNNGALPGVNWYVSPVSDGLHWTLLNHGAQTFTDGPVGSAYDSANHIIYSANYLGGILAMKTGNATPIANAPPLSPRRTICAALVKHLGVGSKGTNQLVVEEKTDDARHTFDARGCALQAHR